MCESPSQAAAESQTPRPALTKCLAAVPLRWSQELGIKKVAGDVKKGVKGKILGAAAYSALLDKLRKLKCEQDDDKTDEVEFFTPWIHSKVALFLSICLAVHLRSVGRR